MQQQAEESAYWEALYSVEDPWNYTSVYEQKKYRHTLDMLPAKSIPRVLELGCAEGMFTQMLSRHAGEILAVDISDRALQRARERCNDLPNVKFEKHDISECNFQDQYELIVCSEILYYLRDRYALRSFASRIKEALPYGGHLLMTHANMVSDDKSQTGFDFNEIGAKFIGDVFSSEPEFEFIRELRTELYRVQLFRRTRSSIQPSHGFTDRSPHVPRELIRRDVAFEHSTIKWGGCVITNAEARHCWVSHEVPVLMYHRVAADGPESLAPYRVSPELFEQQLAYLQRYGYISLNMAEYYDCWFKDPSRPIPGKPIVLTFDDAYSDFIEYAWPLLRKYGFKATVFVPVDYVGTRAEWDIEFGEPARVMNWDEISELHGQGVMFGAHSCCHRRLTEMSESDVHDDAVRARETLEQRLGAAVVDYCYPYAAAGRREQSIIASAGYRSAVGGTGGDGNRNEPYYVPRIEIFGNDTMDEFIGKLPAPEAAPLERRVEYYRLRATRDRATYMGR